MREVLRYIFVMEVTKVFMGGGAQTFWDGGGGGQALMGGLPLDGCFLQSVFL